MLAYVDHVLAVLPFEPDAMRSLGGPATTYVGHRLVADRDVRAVRDAQKARPAAAGLRPATCLLLPGSRGSEIDKLLPVFGETMQELRRRHPDMRFVLPTVPRQEARVRAIVATWPEQPEIRVGAGGKWSAFAEADAAVAASGTVILELGLCRIPTVSTYKVDFLIRLMHARIRTWTGALPNLIADYPFIPEYLNEAIRPGSLVRWVDRLIAETPERAAMLAGFDRVETVMATEVPAGSGPPKSCSRFSRRAAAAEARRPHQQKKARRDGRAFRFSGVRRSALGNRHVVALGSADIELARAADALFRIFDHLVPLGDPADGAGERKEHGEHGRGEAQRLQRDAGIEVDVRVELLLDEVAVRQRDLFQFHGNVEQRIVLDAEFAEDLMAGLLHDLGARIVVLVDAVTEAHQAERIVLVLGLGDVFRNAIDGADFGEHVERRFVGAAMGRAPEAGNAGRDAGKRVGARGAGEANGRGRGVLLMVGMQDEDAVHGAGQNGFT